MQTGSKAPWHSSMTQCDEEDSSGVLWPCWHNCGMSEITKKSWHPLALPSHKTGEFDLVRYLYRIPIGISSQRTVWDAAKNISLSAQLNTSSIKSKHNSFSIYKIISAPPAPFYFSKCTQPCSQSALHFLLFSFLWFTDKNTWGKKKHNARSQGALIYHSRKMWRAV